jgi:hypothetical protein
MNTAYLKVILYSLNRSEMRIYLPESLLERHVSVIIYCYFGTA